MADRLVDDPQQHGQQEHAHQHDVAHTAKVQEGSMVRFPRDKPKASYHRGPHQRIAKRLTDAAKADPLFTCGRCGRTLDEHEPHRNGRRPWWEAGHIIPGDTASGYRVEASTCNRWHGARLGNQRRRQAQQQRPSHNW